VRAAARFALLGLLACDAGSAESWQHDAIRCSLFGERVGVQRSTTERTLTLKRGQHGSVELPPLTLRGLVDGEGFSVWVTHGRQELVRGQYSFAAPLPENQFGDQFTGRLELNVPGIEHPYQLACGAVSSEPHPDRPSQIAASRAQRVDRLFGTLHTLGAPLAKRADALRALHVLQQRTFTNVQLAGANLDGIDLRESHMPDANFAGASLQEAWLYADFLEHANFAEADLQRANLFAAKLKGANLRRADLRAASMERVVLDGASLSSADLRGSYLGFASLRYADLTDADLESANLQGADLTDADLTGANLKGAQLKDAKLQGANLAGARNLDRAQLSGAPLP
jgi:uncharacterized protein YjbI with pentapeptide repeats